MAFGYVRLTEKRQGMALEKDARFDIAATVRRIARADMKSKDIIREVRKKHPGASKKDVVKAAFYAIATDGCDPETSSRLHQ